jgi:hypothetical protein
MVFSPFLFLRRLSGCLRSFVFFEDLQQAVLKLAVLDYTLIIALNTGAVY